ncbi:mannose-P-dolichol utilization defect 1 protein-like isoform 2-T2 [Acanthopagrus schlegelii]
MDTSSVRHFLVSFLMPKKCYEEIFVHLHMHVPCLKFILNKILGLWILLETFLAQPPQLLKILWRRSAAGISLTSALLQLYAFSCPVVYAMAHNFPLSAYSERLLTLAQTAAIVFLILHYREDTLRGALFLSAHGGVIFLLGSYAAPAVASAMQASSVAAVIGSKVATRRLILQTRTPNLVFTLVAPLDLTFFSSFRPTNTYCSPGSKEPPQRPHGPAVHSVCVTIVRRLSGGYRHVSTGDWRLLYYSVTHAVGLSQLCPRGPGPLLQQR